MADGDEVKNLAAYSANTVEGGALTARHSICMEIGEHLVSDSLILPSQRTNTYHSI